MTNLIKQILTFSLSIVSLIFTFVPEKTFGSYVWSTLLSEECNIIINRVLVGLIVVIIVTIVLLIYRKIRCHVTIKGHNYTIKIEYGDLFKFDDCKKVITFDECYSTHVGEEPQDINPTSVCGQFLQENPNIDITNLLESHNVRPLPHPSNYNNQPRYESGMLLPYNEKYLLMSFAKLDANGLARMNSRKDYLEILSVLWSEIDKYYGQSDVAIPIIGSGVTRFNGESPTQQQLLDLIIKSYQLSLDKIKNPNKLHIVCRKRDDFSLNEIGNTL